MFNCPNCGFKCEEARFCPACGTPSTQVQQPDPFLQQQDPFQQGMPSRQKNSFQMPIQQRYQLSRFGAQNNITFIFVSSLIFVIFFAIRCISVLSAFGKLAGIGKIADQAKNYYNLTVFSGIVTFITFAGILTVFILAAISKNTQNPIEKRFNLSKKLFILTITSLALGIVYMISEILLVVEINNLLAQGLLNAEEVSSMRSLIFGSIFFDVIFIVFGIINIIKSKLFADKLRKDLTDKESGFN